MSSLVTIGLPFANQSESYLRQTIRSIFAQSYPHWELILLADGAPSDLVDVVTSIDDPRVRVVVHDKCAGLAARLNEIADLATGEFLFRMDGDDIMHPLRLERQLTHLEANPDLDVLGGVAHVIDEKTRLLGVLNEPASPPEARGFLRSHSFTHPTVVARTEWFRRHRYDPKMLRAEDKDLWLASHKTSTFEKLRDPVLFYRIVALKRQKQAQDAAYDRQVIAHYGPELVGAARTRILLAQSRAKQMVFAGLLALGQAERIHRTKYVPMSQQQRTANAEYLKASLTARVPGWSEVSPTDARIGGIDA